MKNFTLLLFTILLLFLTSCSMQQRHYRKGFYVEHTNKDTNIKTEAGFNVISLNDSSSLEEKRSLKTTDTLAPENSVKPLQSIKQKGDEFLNHQLKKEAEFAKSLPLTVTPLVASRDSLDGEPEIHDKALGFSCGAIFGVTLAFLAIHSPGEWLFAGIAFILAAPIFALVGLVLSVIGLSRLRDHAPVPYEKAKLMLALGVSLISIILIIFLLATYL